MIEYPLNINIRKTVICQVVSLLHSASSTVSLTSRNFPVEELNDVILFFPLNLQLILCSCNESLF